MDLLVACSYASYDSLFHALHLVAFTSFASNKHARSTPVHDTPAFHDLLTFAQLFLLSMCYLFCVSHLTVVLS